jgi:pyrimidine-nucleoside phosphorylase
MRMIDLIIKKRNNHELTKEEIDFIINGYVKGDIPDYQISAFLMAVYFNNMTENERLNLTLAMLNSGEQINLDQIIGVKCDKHSTGGVGDKTSLVVAPLAAACGVKMAKMSGRGLGHTGGTLDKLESVPGLTIDISSEDFYKQVNEIGLAIIGQTANITPADKLLYSLRDVTGTIESIPLIASSIMSKKLASGANNIVLDVKVGSGAFMKDIDTATLLAEAMVEIGNLANRKTVATLTDMNEPLGNAVGNSLEIIEAIETLKGNGPKDFTDLCISFVNEILVVCDICKTFEEANLMTLDVLNSGKGLEKLKLMFEYQHGNGNVVNDYSLLPVAEDKVLVKYQGDKSVYVKSIDALAIGEAAMILGAGRETKEQEVDPSVGVVLSKKVGDFVEPGEVIAKVYTSGKNTDSAVQKVYNAYEFSLEYVEKLNKILKVVR